MKNRTDATMVSAGPEGNGKITKKRQHRQRPITQVRTRRSSTDWITIVEEAKNKELAWKFFREMEQDSVSSGIQGHYTSN